MWKTPEEIDSSGSREIVAQRGAAVQMRSLEAYRKEIAKCGQLPPDKSIPILQYAVFKLPRYNIYQLKERIEVFDLARDTLLSIPGHAQYFADLIEAERAKLSPKNFRNDYDQDRFRYLRETMVHLPSPETVKVLGHYLADDRDIPPPERWDDGGPTPANSIIAMEALLCLELRDAPYPPGRYLERTRFLPAVRAWFAPIQSGETTFSFKGQAVEYRFKPDGTWVSTPIANPPDDAPKPLPSQTQPREHSKPTPQPDPPPAAAATSHLPPWPWPWLATGALAMLAAAWYFLKSRKPPVT